MQSGREGGGDEPPGSTMREGRGADNPTVPGSGAPRLSASGAAAVALGGALGALLRYGVGAGAALLPGASTLPLATLAANALGALLLGVVDGRLGASDAPAGLRLFWATGVCGGFTTFSLVSAEVLALVGAGRGAEAAAYAAASLVLSLGGIALGSALAGGGGTGR